MRKEQVSQHPYAPIIASAMRRPEIWRVGVLILGILLLSQSLIPLFFLIIGQIAPNLYPIQITEEFTRVGATPGGLFVILASFSILIVGTVAMAKRLHARGLRDLTGPAALMRRQFRVTLKAILIFTAVSFLLPWEEGIAPEDNLALGIWLFWVPFAILGLLVQVTSEELLFRGYLQSQIAASTGSYPLGVAAASVLFGLAHINDISGGMATLFPVIWAMGFAALAGDLTMRSGTIGPSIALHFVNNLSAILIAPQQDVMSGFGLFVRTAPPETLYSDPKVMVFQALLLLVTWLVARLALRR